MSNLVSLYPIMFGKYVPEGHVVWNILLQFSHLVELISAQAFQPGNLLHLRDKIEEFLEAYYSTFPEAKLKPKCHYLTHYPSQILELGPPCEHNTIRFEGKHNFFKEVYQCSKNRINIVKTMATQHQFYMYLTYQKRNVTDHECTTSSSNELPVMLLHQNIQERIKLNNPDVTIIHQALSTKYDGQIYSSGSCIVRGFHFDMPFIGKVESIIFVYDTPFLIVQKLKTMHFNSHYNSYEVRETSELDLIKIDDLKDYHPLGLYNVLVGNVKLSLVPMKYHIFQWDWE